VSPCPPVALMPMVAATIRGPSMSPRSIALRRLMSTNCGAPRSRMVVNPASRVARACWASVGDDVLAAERIEVRIVTSLIR
jgi:hypothetical protein